MKKHLFVLFLLIPLSILAVAYAEQKTAMKLKVSYEVYACNCGTECKCNTMANKEGNCTCGKTMSKAKVVRIEGDTAYLKADNWKEERLFTITGKYVCSCAPACTCKAISQNPGKCPCGEDMRKAD